MLWASDKAANLLILFLDMNGYGYNPETAEVWFEGIKKHPGTDAVAIKRALCLLGQYHEGQEFDLGAGGRTQDKQVLYPSRMVHEFFQGNIRIIYKRVFHNISKRVNCLKMNLFETLSSHSKYEAIRQNISVCSACYFLS